MRKFNKPRRRFSLILHCSLFIPHVAALAVLLLPRLSIADPAKWEKDMQAFELKERENPSRPGGVVFAGSSTIRRWDLEKSFPGKGYINRGFGGSQIEDSVFYADRFLAPLAPSVLVFFAGGNDLNAGKTPERVFADFKRLDEKLHAKLPTLRILYMSTNPSVKRRQQMAEQRKLNELIKDYCSKNPLLTYVHTFDALLDSSGQPLAANHVADMLHLNDTGYAIVNKIIGPVIEAQYAQARQ